MKTRIKCCPFCMNHDGLHLMRTEDKALVWVRCRKSDCLIDGPMVDWCEAGESQLEKMNTSQADRWAQKQAIKKWNRGSKRPLKEMNLRLKTRIDDNYAYSA